MSFTSFVVLKCACIFRTSNNIFWHLFYLNYFVTPNSFPRIRIFVRSCNVLTLNKVWSIYSGVAEGWSLLHCDTMSFGKSSETFIRCFWRDCGEKMINARKWQLWKRIKCVRNIGKQMWRLYSANCAYKINQQIKNHVYTCMQKKKK